MTARAPTDDGSGDATARTLTGDDGLSALPRLIARLAEPFGLTVLSPDAAGDLALILDEQGRLVDVPFGAAQAPQGRRAARAARAKARLRRAWT